MANPYIWAVGFLLSVVGSWSGILRIVRFMKASGSGFIDWLFRRSAKSTVEKILNIMRDRDVSIEDASLVYTTFIADMILQFVEFIIYLAIAFYILGNGLNPFYEDVIFKILCIPFFIFSFICIFEMGIIRFEMYLFKTALPELRARLNSLNSLAADKSD
jgi:hypothetical protein